MADQDEAAEKNQEPSPRKLEEARKKGEIPRSVDLLTASSYLGFLICCLVVGRWQLLSFSENMLPLLERPDQIDIFGQSGGGTLLMTALLSGTLTSLALFFIFPMSLVLLSLIATRGFVFTPTKLLPKASRINPIENAKNKYGRKGLFEFAKSFAKLVLFSLVLFLIIRSQISEIIGAVREDPHSVIMLISSLFLRIFLIVFLVAVAIGAIDAFWQHSEHIRKNRMSQKELRDEMKETEGDPHLKQHRRMRAQEMALNQMITEVPKADVIIVNPTHYAVALSWSRLPGSAPVCVAKGCDHVAARIRTTAQEAGVPIHSDPPTARAIYATVDLGNEVTTDLYQPVAAAIRFADSMRKKASKWSAHAR